MRALLVNPRSIEVIWSFGRQLEIIGKKDVGPPPLGLLTVAALLPEEWDLRMADLNVRDMTEEDWDHCDLLLLTAMTTSYSSAVEIIREGKRRGKTVVFGGPLVFHATEEAMKLGADIVVKGEGETAVPLLLEALAAGKSGLIIEAPACPDLSDSPLPRYALVDMKKYLMMGVQFSRGCPFTCEFCDITVLYGRKVRTKPAGQILLELQNLYDMGWRGYVFFVDDNLIGDRDAATSLLKELVPWMHERRYPFEFITQASVNLGDDPELLDLVVRGGFISVQVGIEADDPDTLRLTKKYQNVRTNLDESVERMKQGGLQLIASFILGFDNEAPAADQRVIDFAVRHQIPQIVALLLQVGPGTALWKRLEQEGRLLWTGPDDDLGSNTGMINFVPTRPVREIAEEYIRLQDVLYDPDSYLERTFRYFAAMKPPPRRRFWPFRGTREVLAMPRLLFKHSRAYSSPWIFWKVLIAALFKFPFRLRDFLITCSAGEHLSQYRHTIRDKIRERLARKHRDEV